MDDILARIIEKNAELNNKYKKEVEFLNLLDELKQRVKQALEIRRGIAHQLETNNPRSDLLNQMSEFTNFVNGLINSASKIESQANTDIVDKNALKNLFNNIKYLVFVIKHSYGKCDNLLNEYFDSSFGNDSLQKKIEKEVLNKISS